MTNVHPPKLRPARRSAIGINPKSFCGKPTPAWYSSSLAEPANVDIAMIREGDPPRRRVHLPGRHVPTRLIRMRPFALRRGGVVALLAVLGPGLLAGLSDDDPAGVTTYSILGAEHGYRLLWVLTLSTAALIVFHELGARMGVVTGIGLLALIRERFGARVTAAAITTLVIANLGTMCAEFAGVAAGAELLGGVPRSVSVPVAGLAVSVLVLRGSFHRVEHVLLTLSAVFAAYFVSGILARPDWGAVARGLVVPSMPLTQDAVLLVVATVGTTLAPWGLAFIQSYAVDKKLRVEKATATTTWARRKTTAAGGRLGDVAFDAWVMQTKPFANLERRAEAVPAPSG